MSDKPENTALPEAGLANVRLMWARLRRWWRLPNSMVLFTPGFSAMFLLTAVSLGLTITAKVLLSLLPRMEQINELRVKLSTGILDVLAGLPKLLELASSSTEVFTGALVAPEAYIIVYALGIVTAFCFLMLLVAFVRRW